MISHYNELSCNVLGTLTHC